MESFISKVYKNKFSPSRGTTPAFLEGRKEVCEKIHTYIREVMNGSSPDVVPVILGPIGIGKSAILRWIESHAKNELPFGESLHITYTSGSMLQSPEDARKLIGGRVDGEIWKQVCNENKDYSKADIITERRAWEKGNYAPIVSKAIAKQFVKSTNIILVDDAQLIEIDALGTLIDTINWQKQIDGARALLVLGGRQGVLDVTESVKTKRVFRNVTIEIIRLRSLNFEEVCKSLRSTLALGEISISAEELTNVAAETKGHPLFVQYWGNLLWNRVRWYGRKCVIDEDVKEVKRILGYRLGKVAGFKRTDWNSSELAIIIEIGKVLQLKEVLSWEELEELVIKTGESIGLEDYPSRMILETILREDIIDRDCTWGGYKEAIQSRIEYFVGNGSD